jgi:hypothetical protein
MVALRRGVAHYANGDSDVSYDPMTGARFSARPAAPTPTSLTPAPAPAPTSTPTSDVFYDPMSGARFSPSTPASAPEPTWRSPLSTIRNMITGQIGNVAADPNQSAFSHYLAGAAQNTQTNQRVQNLASGPSSVEKLVLGLFGDQSDWANVKDRDVTAKTLGHPLVQQHMRIDPNALEAAERDPAAFSRIVQLPEYVNHMKETQRLHAEALNDPKVHPDDAAKTAAKARAAGTTASEAHTSVAPQNYSRDEFIRIVGNMPTRTVLALFGPSIAHNADPKVIATKKYLGNLDDEFRMADTVYTALLDDPTSKDTGFFGGLFGGESRLAKAKAERDKAWAARQRGLARVAGAASKSFATGED